ncbi:MAG TPA: signal peptidase II [Pedobacter sp.]|nr:signal peptidase II [Pedobacter sp.]
MKHIVRTSCILFIILINAGCDQISKHIARENLVYNNYVSVIGKKLVLIKTENSGAFLSIGESMTGTLKFLTLSLIPMATLLFGIYFLIRHTHLPRLLVTGICFVIGGGLGNLIDRLLYGSVTDFLHMDFYGLKTGIFNLADVSIMIGMGMILINIFFTKNKIRGEVGDTVI